jgi:plastocyanin
MVIDRRSLSHFALVAIAALCVCAPAQEQNAKIDVHLRIQMPAQKTRGRTPPAVLWLKPVSADTVPLPPATSRYTLMQKNRMFLPHLLVVPVGSTVYFPNADPFFHNVFSLFNGKRFDLGLYEAGTTKEEVFPREGVSYIFCNIHPEMSAVILVLGTPYYAVAGPAEGFQVHGVPVGEYEMHVWVEGLTQQVLDRFTRRVEVTADGGDLGLLDASSSTLLPPGHLNKFGRPYDRDSKPTY